MLFWDTNAYVQMIWLEKIVKVRVFFSKHFKYNIVNRYSYATGDMLVFPTNILFIYLFLLYLCFSSFLIFKFEVTQ